MSSKGLISKETVRTLAHKALEKIEDERLAQIEKSKIEAYASYKRQSFAGWLFGYISFEDFDATKFDGWYGHFWDLRKENYKKRKRHALENLISMVNLAEKDKVWISSQDAAYLEEGVE
jgi:hypothetical protein